MQSIVTRLSALFNVTRIFNSFAFADEAFNNEMNVNNANAANVINVANVIDAANATKAAIIIT